jgi:hypothetical protein
MMLQFLRGQASDRKLRLFAVACVQRYAAFNGVIRGAIRVSELYADGITNRYDLAAVRRVATQFQRQSRQWRVVMGAGAVGNVSAVAHPSAFAAAQGILPTVVPDVAIHGLGEVFGNPYQPAVVDPSWLSWNEGTVVKLAQSIYSDRAFDRLPILADALEESGCYDAGILAHCRGPGPHVLGCFVLDALLGKS